MHDELHMLEVPCLATMILLSTHYEFYECTDITLVATKRHKPPEQSTSWAAQQLASIGTCLPCLLFCWVGYNNNNNNIIIIIMKKQCTLFVQSQHCGLKCWWKFYTINRDCLFINIENKYLIFFCSCWPHSLCSTICPTSLVIHI